jgi:Dihydrofolate reductase
MNLIAAVDQNWGIGIENKLLFQLPLDLEFFKSKTIGKVIVMGKNTLLSLPGANPLPNRVNIVLSKTIQREDCLVCHSLEDLFATLSNYKPEDVFVMGGEQLYNEMLPYCEKAYLTKIKALKKATHFFPNLDLNHDWVMVKQSEKASSNGVDLCFCEYRNITIRNYREHNCFGSF